MRRLLSCGILMLALCSPARGAAGDWMEALLSTPASTNQPSKVPLLQPIRLKNERLLKNLSILKTPLIIGHRHFQRGLGTHAISHFRIYSPEPISRLTAWVGVDNNSDTRGGRGSAVFLVSSRGKELFRSRVMHGGEEPQKVDMDAGAENTLDFQVGDAGDGTDYDQGDWAEAKITTVGGKTLWLDDIQRGTIPTVFTSSKFPFSFMYDGKPSGELLEKWSVERTEKKLDDARQLKTTVWTDPQTGLRVTWDVIYFSDYPALDWVLHFENTGKADTKIVQSIRALDVTVSAPMSEEAPYILHRTHGGSCDPQQFEPSVEAVNDTNPRSMDAGGGRSSSKDFPFFKIETGKGSIIAAVGWSGYWVAHLECPDNKNLNVTAGMDPTHFLLHPGEKVRSPRMLLMDWPGDTLQSNAEFRQLIYKHYVAKRDGKIPLPVSFCNTCFTRGGGWLNECNAENQISLIKAYAKLGLDALMTDAGWFTGGWPEGAGNWDPRKDAYPHGMGPVAAAAKEQGMIYGLWYEPERVIHGTTAQREHPEWCLGSQKGLEHTYLLNFGLPEVQNYFFDIVKDFMALPGFGVYRQDFNMDPRAYWLFNDAPDRQGITEMKYIEGLYAYWDRLASTWPDSLREECASGGNRIDLETIMRLHIAQKTDFWFNDDVDQAATWGLSQYLPNNTFVAHLIRLDDYSFHSTMATSLCLGWIADAPDFDSARGKELLGRYDQLRHLLVGAWYPLLPYTRDPLHWMASQYYRSDLGEGMILAFRHSESPYAEAEVALHGLDPKATYEFSIDGGETFKIAGADAMKEFRIAIPKKHASELIVYRKIGH